MSGNELAGSQSTVGLGDVLGAVASRVERQFEALLHDLPNQESGNRPQALLQFVHGARQQLLRSAAILYDTRKFLAAQPLVEQGGILDVAASHVRSMQQAADQLHMLGQMLQGSRVPLYNIPDAVDVLSSGTYSSFPAGVPGMHGQLTDAQQQRLISQMNHMLYSRLLKAKLPGCLQLIKVLDGFAVLRCKGLYEAQLTLGEQIYPPQVEEARQDAAAEAAKQRQEEQKQQQALLEPGSSAAAEAAAAAAATQTAAVTPQQSPPADSQPIPAKRWVWWLHFAVVLPGAASKPPLRPEQHHQLMELLIQRMRVAADAAALEAARQQGMQEGGGQIAAGAASQSQQQQSGPTSSSAGPSVSGVSAGAASTASDASELTTAGRVDAGRGLDLKKYAADENSFPLLIMHGVLRDVAAQLLLDGSMAAAKQLTAAGSKWEGHLRLSKAEVLTPGFRMHYWQKVPVYLPGQPAGVSTASTKDGHVSLPAVELGVGSDGTVQVLHLPPLRQPGSLQQVPLELDSHSVDIEGLLLQAVAVTASTHLRYLRNAVSQGFHKRGIGQFVQLQLSSFGAEHAVAAQVQCREEHQQADANAAANVSTLVVADAAGTPATVPVGMPSSLVVVLDGHAFVSVSFQPWSGKVLLRPGSVYGGNRNMEMGIQLHQQQEQLQQKQEQAKLRRNIPEQQAAAQCLQELGAAIADACTELWMKMQLSSFLAAARRFSLHHTNHTLKGLHQQHLLMLQLPSAAAALGRRAGDTAAGASAIDGRGPAAVSSSVTAASRSGNTLHLALPNLQLPSYMLLLAGGSWCRDRLRHHGGPTGPGGLPAAVAAPSEVAALAPTLCMSFPRRRVPGESRDWLLLMLCDAQGLAGPVLETVRIPVSCFPQQSVAAAAAAAAAADLTAASGDRKRKRNDSSEQQRQPAGDADGQATAAVQKQSQQQQQEQRPKQQQVLLVQPEDHAADIGAAVQWCQSRVTFERLLLEMRALQLQFVQVQPLQQVQQRGLWQQPAIKLLSVPGVDVFQKLQRKPGCSPSSMGLSEVWFTTGPEYGLWNMQLRGSFYHQQQPKQQQRQQQHRTAAANAAVDSRGPGASEGSLAGIAHYQYDLRLGHDVRSAVLQLCCIVRTQQFLHRLECLALGKQSLHVVEVTGGVAWSNRAGAGAHSDADNAAEDETAPAPGVAAAGTDRRGLADGIDADADIPAAKRLKQQQQQSDSEVHLANGPVSMNGVNHEQQQKVHQLAGQNGLLAGSAAAAADPGLAAAPVEPSSGSPVTVSSSGSSASSYGLLFHWQGTGLVRLASYSIAAAAVECGAPLAAPPAAAAPAVKSEPGLEAVGAPQPHQQREHSQQRLRLSVTWQPRFEFSTDPSSGVYSHDSSCNSSSTTTTCVDVRPSMMHSAGSANGWPLGRAAQPADVLDMACSISCDAAYVPTDVLNELCDMAGSGCVDVLLDALAVLGWPLAAVTNALGMAAAAAPGADGLGVSNLACSSWASAKHLHGTAVAAAAHSASRLQGIEAIRQLGVSAVSCKQLSGIFHVQYKFLLLPHQQQQQPLDAAGSSSQASAAAAVPADYSAGALAIELLLASRGTSKLLVSYQHGAVQQQQLPGAVAPGAAAPAAQASGSSSAAESKQLVVDVSAALEGLYKHIAAQVVAKQQRVALLPVLSSGRYMTQLPQPGSLSAREGLAGFFVQNKHLGYVLQQLLHYWQQQVVPGAVRRAQGLAAPAAAGNQGATVKQQPQVKQERAATPPIQLQQQVQQQPAVPQAVPGAQQQAQLPSHQQQQQYIQQQQHMPSNHIMHQLHQPAAGHVASGI